MIPRPTMAGLRRLRPRPPLPCLHSASAAKLARAIIHSGTSSGNARASIRPSTSQLRSLKPSRTLRPRRRSRPASKPRASSTHQKVCIQTTMPNCQAYRAMPGRRHRLTSSMIVRSCRCAVGRSIRLMHVAPSCSGGNVRAAADCSGRCCCSCRIRYRHPIAVPAGWPCQGVRQQRRDPAV
ncbi:hypothetical protein D3C80_1180650 [compost metagenome]